MVGIRHRPHAAADGCWRHRPSALAVPLTMTTALLLRKMTSLSRPLLWHLLMTAAAACAGVGALSKARGYQRLVGLGSARARSYGLWLADMVAGCASHDAMQTKI